MPCKQTTYAVTQQITYEDDKRWNPCVVFFTVTFDFTEEVVEETLVIGLADLLASIGGLMGLITGTSLLTIAEYVEGSVESFYEKVKMWKRARKSPKPAGKRCVSAISVEEMGNEN